MTSSTRSPSDESGGALILALAFIFVMSIVLTGVLAMSESSVYIGQRVGEQRDLTYAADAGIEAAINHIRNEVDLAVNPDAGLPGECWPSATPFVAPATNDVTVEVTCEAEPLSGYDEGGPTTPSNRPGQAILTLSPTEALHQASNAELRVGGHVHSHAAIEMNSNATMLVRGDIHARGGCAAGATVTEDFERVCGPGAAPLADPAYPLVDQAGSPLTAPPAREVVPPCSGSTVTLEPGWYDDAAALTDCVGNRVMWFRPGVYYFDFTGPTKTWTIDNANVTIIGGTYAGSTPNRDDGCLRDAANGVQFVFGGDSRLDVRAGTMDLCASATTDRQQIAIYGVRADAGPGPQNVTLTPATAATTAGVFDDPANGARVDGAWAVAPLAPGRSTATIRVSSFDPQLDIPEGSTIDAASLRITHRETSDVSAIAAQLSTAGGTQAFQGHNNCNNNRPFCRSETSRTSELDITDWVASDLRRLQDLTVDYTVTANNQDRSTRRAELDGVEITVAYTPPQLRATSGCAAATPYVHGNSATCPILNIDGNHANTAFFGTVYVPRGVVAINLPNASRQGFNRGIVARTARLSVPPSTDGDSPFPEYVTVPEISPGGVNDRAVTLRATCTSTSGALPCPTDPVLAETEVTFDSAAGADVTIERWLTVR